MSSEKSCGWKSRPRGRRRLGYTFHRWQKGRCRGIRADATSPAQDVWSAKRYLRPAGEGTTCRPIDHLGSFHSRSEGSIRCVAHGQAPDRCEPRLPKIRKHLRYLPARTASYHCGEPWPRGTQPLTFDQFLGGERMHFTLGTIIPIKHLRYWDGRRVEREPSQTRRLIAAVVRLQRWAIAGDPSNELRRSILPLCCLAMVDRRFPSQKESLHVQPHKRQARRDCTPLLQDIEPSGPGQGRTQSPRLLLATASASISRAFRSSASSSLLPVASVSPLNDTGLRCAVASSPLAPAEIAHDLQTGRGSSAHTPMASVKVVVQDEDRASVDGNRREIQLVSQSA